MKFLIACMMISCMAVSAQAADLGDVVARGRRQRSLVRWHDHGVQRRLRGGRERRCFALSAPVVGRGRLFTASITLVLPVVHRGPRDRDRHREPGTSPSDSGFSTTGHRRPN